MLMLVLLAWPAVAAAQWTPVAPGVDFWQRTDPGPVRVSALRVDLCEPGVRVRATASGERGQTTSSWAGGVGVAAAVNGGFFVGGYAPDAGLAAGNGVEWPDSGDTVVRGALAFGHRDIEHFSSGFVNPLPGWAGEAVNGDATLVFGGSAINCGGCGGGRHPRTAVGWTADERTMFAVVVDGRSSSSIGMTIDELAVLMAGFGVDRAMNLDGGGSSTLWTTTGGVENVPSDGSQRVVANHLGVFASGVGSAWNCPDIDWQGSVVGVGGGIGWTTTAAPGSVVSGWIDVQNTGGQAWPQGQVRLGTTGPRDRASSLQAPGWLGASRMAQTIATVPPGATARFDVSFQVPATEGTYVEEFGLVYEWVSWFGDDGGPADDAIAFTVVSQVPPVGDDDDAADDDDAGDDDDATPPVADDDDATPPVGDDDDAMDDDDAGDDDDVADDDDIGDDDDLGDDDDFGDDDFGDDDDIGDDDDATGAADWLPVPEDPAGPATPRGCAYGGGSWSLLALLVVGRRRSTPMLNPASNAP